jgi:hypothetical protein
MLLYHENGFGIKDDKRRETADLYTIHPDIILTRMNSKSSECMIPFDLHFQDFTINQVLVPSTVYLVVAPTPPRDEKSPEGSQSPGNHLAYCTPSGTSMIPPPRTCFYFGDSRSGQARPRMDDRPGSSGGRFGWRSCNRDDAGQPTYSTHVPERLSDISSYRRLHVG